MKKYNNPIITVSVTAYKRPQMIEDVIRSFQLQGFKNAELVILDDCVQDQSVKRMVEKYQKEDKRIRFVKNKVNLGYCKNFLNSLILAKGKYIITLGDDDVLLSEEVLQKYYNVFEKYPMVGYIYPNIMQFNEKYEIDFISEHFKKNTLFKTTRDALEHIWLYSCYIPGIGLRNNVNFKNLYSKDDILFPQVELIGKILGTYQAYGISEFLIGGRAHRGQLGFAALRGEKIKSDEKHSVIELEMIFKRVMDYYKNVLKKKIVINDAFIYKFFEQTHATILPNEKIQAGNAVVWQTFLHAFKNHYLILFNLRFMTYLMLALALPPQVLFYLKEYRKKQMILMYHKGEKAYFDSYIEKICPKAKRS